MMNRPVALLALVLSILLARPAPASPMKYILVFGDSLSQGETLKRGQAYPMRLVEKLRAAGLNYELMNASQSGGTTTSGLERLPPHLKHKIDIFILELGINDLFRGIPLGEIQINLQEIIDRVRRANPSVRLIICGMQLPNQSADDYIAAFGKIYVDLAARNSAALVPYLLEGVAGHPALNLPDRIHPNPAGHKILAENVWRVLQPIAKSVSENAER